MSSYAPLEQRHAPALAVQAPSLAAAQRAPAPAGGLADMLNGGPRVQTQLKLGQALNGSPRANVQAGLVQRLGECCGPTQRAGIEDELAQTKSVKTAQRAGIEDELAQTKSAKTAQRAGIEDELAQTKSAKTAQRAGIEDELAQTKSAKTAQRSALEEEITQTKPVQAKKENQTGMPDSLKSGIESLSGVSMDNVRVHYNSPKPAQLEALAYTQGSDIHVGPGQESALPHEAWHAVQQKQGRVQPNIEVSGVPVNNDTGLETEADVMGKRAAG